MKDSLIIDGRIYISSRRGAEMSRYSNDYIGQLCRGGKVPAQMMGRTWFVDQEALLKHKKNAEDAFKARCLAASREQQRVFAMGTTVVLPSYVGSSPLIFDQMVRSEKAVNALIPSARQDMLSDYREHPVHVNLLQRSVSVILVIIIIATGGFILEKNSSIISRIESSSQGAHVYASVERIIGAISDGFDRVLAIFENGFSRQPKYVVNTVSPVDDAGDAWNGMAVVPSGSANDATKTRIKNYFSDVVEITPDQSGTAGVIKPLFKETGGDDFMYVLVPVKEEKTR